MNLFNNNSASYFFWILQVVMLNQMWYPTVTRLPTNDGDFLFISKVNILLVLEGKKYVCCGGYNFRIKKHANNFVCKNPQSSMQKIRNLHAKNPQSSCKKFAKFLFLFRSVGWSWLEHSNAAGLCVPVAGGHAAAARRVSSPSRQQSLDPY